VLSDEGAFSLFIIRFPAWEERSAPVPQAEPALDPSS